MVQRTSDVSWTVPSLIITQSKMTESTLTWSGAYIILFLQGNLKCFKMWSGL